MESFERARLDAYFAKIAAQFAPDEQVTVASWSPTCCPSGPASSARSPR